MSLPLIFSLSALPSFSAAAIAAALAAFLIWGIVKIDLLIFRPLARSQ